MRYLHNFLTVYAKVSTPHHLQIHCGQWQRSPFTSRLLVHFGDFGILRSETPLQHDCHGSPIKEVNSLPEEADFDSIADMHDFDAPELFRFEIFDPQVTIDHET